MLASAASPSVAVSASKPSTASSFCATSRFTGLSSTSRMRTSRALAIGGGNGSGIIAEASVVTWAGLGSGGSTRARRVSSGLWRGTRVA